MEKNLKSIELNKILELLANEIPCEDGKTLARELNVTTDLKEVNHLLNETYDAHSLIGRFGFPYLNGLKNITALLKKAEAGSCLMMGELLLVARVLSSIRGLKDWKNHSSGVESCLDDRFNLIYTNKYLEEKILSIIISEEEISDNASTELSNIRRKIRQTSSKARDSLDKLIHSQTYQKYLQDPIVTIRGGRFVVPVKSEFRTNIQGLVHDTSASGATVFIEPISVVEANNELRLLKSKEENEIQRILRELSNETGSFSAEIISSYNICIDLSLIFGKANLAYKMRATLPLMNDKGIINLKKARHPLINKDVVVPIDVNVGKNFDTLIITGPNTGGKTVTLKTIGLLSAMAMCGMMIPAGDESELSCFDNILVDIGDEQSIEQSLSTFSAHISNIIKILDTVTDKSLVLIDELGAGTDPVEGAALAIAIIEKARLFGAKIVSTTHYAELKSFALNTKGIENGSCEFDVATLKPTYKLLIGVPGRSNAFAISKRLGLSEHVVNRAKELVSTESKIFEDVIDKLEEKRQLLEKEISSVESSKIELKSSKKILDEKIAQINKNTDLEIEKAEKKAAEILEKAEKKAYELLDKLETKLKQESSLSNDDKANLRAEIKSLSKSTGIKKSKKDDYKLPRTPKPGDNILVIDIDKKASIIEVDEKNKQALVQLGIFKSRISFDNIKLLENEKVKINKGSAKFQKSSNISKAVTEIDLRGMTALEAIIELDNAIDSAVLMNIGIITVIHGKGTGVLRTEVHKHLKGHKAVKSFRLGTFGEGESGVTIIEMK